MVVLVLSLCEPRKERGVGGGSCLLLQIMRGKAARHGRQGSEECESEIPNPNKKTSHKLPKLTVG